MAASSESALGPLRFTLDRRWVDQTVYLFATADGSSGVSVTLELPAPRVDPAPVSAAQRRIRAAGEELSRIYDDIQLGTPVELATGLGRAVAVRARVLGTVELNLAAVEYDGHLVFVTGTTESGAALDFGLVVESIRPLQALRSPAPPGHRLTGAGPVSLLVPVTFGDPSTCRFTFGSALVEVHASVAPAIGVPEPQTLLPFDPAEAVAIDDIQPPEVGTNGRFRSVTAVATYTVRDAAAVPTDAVMVRTSDLSSVAGGDSDGDGTVTRLVGAARSVDWSLLIASWSQLLASLHRDAR